MLQLFETELPKNDSPLQDVDITTTIMYYSTKELKRFKQLCKIGIKQMFGAEYVSKGNIADLILNLLEERYGKS